jgi:hypothetical protein
MQAKRRTQATSSRGLTTAPMSIVVTAGDPYIAAMRSGPLLEASPVPATMPAAVPQRKVA